MFAPRPFDVAKELVRVTRPGGRIVMGNWIPGDPTLVAQILKISSAYSPPPPEGFISPMTWGVEADVVERFASAGVPKDGSRSSAPPTRSTSRARRRSYLAEFREYYGPTMNAYAAAAADGREADLHAELEELFNAQNTEQRRHHDPRDVPARHRQGLNETSNSVPAFGRQPSYM